MDKIALTNGSSPVQPPAPAKPVARSNSPAKATEVQLAKAKDEPVQQDDVAQDARAAELESFAAKAFEDDASRLSIRYHADSGRFVYRELDNETGEVVKEYPAEEVLERLKKNAEVREELAFNPLGLTFDKNL